jgi:spore photoproduct lyase
MIPEVKRKLHEPETSTIQERIEAINKFKDAGYEVHLNFSPIMVYDGWLDDYEELFALINNHVKDTGNVLAECIFLTHNANRHYRNLLDGKKKEEKDLWVPEMQETKISQYGGENIRYKHEIKKQFVDAFIKEHDNIIPWNRIRYIF